MGVQDSPAFSEAVQGQCSKGLGYVYVQNDTIELELIQSFYCSLALKKLMRGSGE